MKRFLDDFLYQKINKEDCYVIAADVGYFPKSRKCSNFIDVGNNEFCVGSVAEGLLSKGNNVFIYDICGYILKNSYASLFARNNTYYENKGILTILGWGSGFSYDGCLLGHYPFDDLCLAKLLGLSLKIPYNKNSFLSYIEDISSDSYIRMFDLNIYKNERYFFPLTKYKYVFVGEGWIYPLLLDLYGNNKNIMIVPSENSSSNLIRFINKKNVIYFTDQIEPIYSFDSNMTVIHSDNPNLKNVQDTYKNKESFIKNQIIDKVKKLNID